MERKHLSPDQYYRRTVDNIITMLEDQNFLNPDGHDDNFDIAVEAMGTDQIEYTDHLDGDRKCIVLFLNSDNILKRDSIRKLVDFDNKNVRYLLVVQDMDIVKHLKGICKTHTVHKNLILQNMANPRISVFRERDFDLKKMRHKFQPKFRILNSDETVALIKRYGKLEHFPVMFDSDYVAKHYNVKTEVQKDAIFEVISPSETSGSCISYRHVVPHYLGV